jgi:hypothetical protein
MVGYTSVNLQKSRGLQCCACLNYKNTRVALGCKRYSLTPAPPPLARVQRLCRLRCLRLKPRPRQPPLLLHWLQRGRPALAWPACCCPPLHLPLVQGQQQQQRQQQQPRPLLLLPPSCWLWLRWRASQGRALLAAGAPDQTWQQPPWAPQTPAAGIQGCHAVNSAVLRAGLRAHSQKQGQRRCWHYACCCWQNHN